MPMASMGLRPVLEMHHCFDLKIVFYKRQNWVFIYYWPLWRMWSQVFQVTMAEFISILGDHGCWRAILFFQPFSLFTFYIFRSRGRLIPLFSSHLPLSRQMTLVFGIWIPSLENKRDWWGTCSSACSRNWSHCCSFPLASPIMLSSGLSAREGQTPMAYFLVSRVLSAVS